MKKNYYAAGGANVKSIKVSSLTHNFHQAAIGSLITHPEKHQVQMRTNKGKLEVGRIISREPLRKKGYVYEVTGAGIKKKTAIDKQKYLDSHNWHHVQTNKTLYTDKKRKRAWVKGQRIHHGAPGLVVHVAAQAIPYRNTRQIISKSSKRVLKHDIKDKFIMFEAGPGYQGAEVFRPKPKHAVAKAYRQAHRKYGHRGH